MQAKLIIYEHASNGVSLFVVPDTDAERELLKGLWKHGRLARCNGIADGSESGFSIQWKLDHPATTPENQVLKMST